MGYLLPTIVVLNRKFDEISKSYLTVCVPEYFESRSDCHSHYKSFPMTYLPNSKVYILADVIHSKFLGQMSIFCYFLRRSPFCYFGEAFLVTFFTEDGALQAASLLFPLLSIKLNLFSKDHALNTVFDLSEKVLQYKKKKKMEKSYWNNFLRIIFRQMKYCVHCMVLENSSMHFSQNPLKIVSLLQKFNN